MSLDAALEAIRSRARSERDKGAAFERLVRKALLTHPGEFGSHRFERIVPWAEWEGAGGSPDTGIDLVGYQHGGGLAAIQCKFYSPGHAVKKGDIDGFIAKSNRPEFTARVLVNTGDAFTPHAARLMSEVVPHVELVLLEDMRRWPVADWSGCLDDDGTLVWDHEPYTPMPHQQAAIDAVLAGFAAADRGKMILPCGTGKSVTAMWIAEQQAGAGGIVLYLVPSIALMGQTMREWAANRQLKHRYVGVCSDRRAGRTAEDETLAELTMPVTTDPDRVAGALAPAEGALSVVFCTYHSLPVISDAQHKTGGSFDLIVCDEAHRTTGLDRDDGSAWQMVHDNSRVPASKRLYMTATPKVYTEAVKTQAADRDFGVYSMDDETAYGPEFHRLTFKDAVDRGLLCDYQVVAIAVDASVLPGSEPGKDKLGGTNLSFEDSVKFAGVLDALADPTTDGVERSSDRATGTVNPLDGAKRAITFNHTINQSKQVEQYLPMVADRLFSQADAETRRKTLIDLSVRHIDGKLDALTRARHIQWLRDTDPGDTGCLMLTNARCLTEGVDVPALDAIVFATPRKSQIDVVQAVGRVMRNAPDKHTGYVVLPVVVKDGTSAADALDTSAFKDVWAVLRALRSHDERLDVIVNSADLAAAGRLPVTVLDATRVGRAARSGGVHGPGAGEQLELEIEFGLRGKVASVLVDKVGDKQHWKRWGKRTASIAASVQADIDKLRKTDALEKAWAEFAAGIRERIGGTDLAAGGAAFPDDAELARMLAQHAITMPVFEALFKGSRFADRNPMCLALSGVLDEFTAGGLDTDTRCAPLVGFYKSVDDRLAGAVTGDARIGVLLEVYEGFFEAAMPDVCDKLGLVYTPVEIVDFVLRSADAVARQQFGRGLTDDDVHILDPFTGTGTFINRLITGHRTDGGPLIEDADLDRKFSGDGDDTPPELHANELVLLAYYIAAVKIEEGYAERMPHAGYRPVQGLVWGDTFRIEDERVTAPLKGMRRNSRRAHRQNDQPITVIVSNPPWSAGQKSSGDDNPNNPYPHISARVRETYSSRHKKDTHKAPGGNSAGNLYVQAIRWASDRLPKDQPGLIAFVHPNSLSTGTALAGMRAVLRDEFTNIYVANLLGDAMKSGDEFRREGAKVFGQGSRNGVQITVLVRNPNKRLDVPAVLRYAEVPECSTLQQKFDWLAETGDVTSDRFKVVQVKKKVHDWVNLTDGTFETLTPVCRTDGTDVGVACCRNASGVKTNCDAYVYSFSREALSAKVQTLIGAYNDALELVDAGCTVKECTANDELDRIKWTDTLKQSLRKREEIAFDESRIREVLYRPFTKLWLYEDDRILSSVKTVSAMFPREAESAGGGGVRMLLPHQNNRGAATCLAGAWLTDLNVLGPNQGGCRAVPRRRS